MVTPPSMAIERDHAPRWAFLVLKEHPYGREMLSTILAAGFEPSLIVEEASAIADEERRKFQERIAGFDLPPTFERMLAGRSVRRIEVPNHNKRACREALESLSPDLLVLGGTRILKPRIYETSKDGALNAHPGLLPEVRGSASVAWAIHLDLPVGCTCHFIEAGIDTGPVVGREVIAVRRGDTYEKLCRETLRVSARLMAEALIGYAAGTLQRVPQPVGGSAHRNMPEEMVEAVRRKLADGRYAHFLED